MAALARVPVSEVPDLVASLRPVVSYLAQEVTRDVAACYEGAREPVDTWFGGGGRKERVEVCLLASEMLAEAAFHLGWCPDLSDLADLADLSDLSDLADLSDLSSSPATTTMTTRAAVKSLDALSVARGVRLRRTGRREMVRMVVDRPAGRREKKKKDEEREKEEEGMGEEFEFTTEMDHEMVVRNRVMVALGLVHDLLGDVTMTSHWDHGTRREGVALRQAWREMGIVFDHRR